MTDVGPCSNGAKYARAARKCRAARCPASHAFATCNADEPGSLKAVEVVAVVVSLLALPVVPK